MEEENTKFSGIIDGEGIKNYINKNGTRIVIPKEAKIIKNISKEINEMLLKKNEKNIELIFEEGSKIETIEDGAFEYCQIVNQVVFPKNLKKIGKNAFMGNPIIFDFSEDSKLEECDEELCFENSDCMVVPRQREEIKMLYTKAKKIVIPENSKIKQIRTLSFSDVKKIVLPDGEIVCSEDEKISYFEMTKDRYNIIYYKEMENHTETPFLVSIDKRTQEKMFEMKMSHYFSNSEQLYTIEFENIWDVDLSNLDVNLMYPVYINLKSDNIDYFFGKNGFQKGKIYTIAEIKEIQNKLNKIVSKINVPSKETVGREKIIYAQIVKQLCECVQYDYENADLINSEDDYEDEQKEKQADETQNLKGLLKGKTVCAGFAKIVETLSEYFGIDCKVISNRDHAWNIVTLDGGTYEDDFTWYENDLQTSNILGMKYFLQGINAEGKRSFESEPFHKSVKNYTLCTDLPKNQRFNLLSTDWGKVKDWEKINLNKPIPNYAYQIDFLAKSKKTMCMLAKDYINNYIEISIKLFIEKVKSFFRAQGDDNDER